MARDRNILMMLCSPRAEEKAVGMISLEILAYMTSLDIMMELKKESIETNIENSMKVSDNARPIMDNPIRRLQTHSNILIGNIKIDFKISKSIMSPDRILLDRMVMMSACLCRGRLLDCARREISLCELVLSWILI